MLARIIFALTVLTNSLAGFAATVSYEFDIDARPINVTGATIEALSIGGQIPAPTIEAVAGDTLRVTFHNRLDVTSSVHWHGVLLPSDQDGVPYMNTQPVPAHGSFTFEYPVLQAGTFWYHSHTDLQIQRGIYGSIVFRKPGEQAQLQEQVVLFSDWTDENPDQVLANLKKDDDYYAFKKDAVQSWDKVLANGQAAVRNRFESLLTRMGPMDLADVGYDAFLANGQTSSSIALRDDRSQQMLLRLINGSTSSYFDVEYAGGPMTIIAADGQDVEPIRVKRLRISTAETYDVLVPVNADNGYELRATSFDGSGHSSVYIGEGPAVMAPDIPRPNLFLMEHGEMDMDMDMDMDMEMDMEMDMDSMASMDHAMPMPMPAAEPAAAQPAATNHVQAMPMAAMDAVIEHMTDYSRLVAINISSLPAERPWHEIPLTLTGNMERYVWSFNGLTLREETQWQIQEGDNIRMRISNSTMMHHPLHLHGHFFRVINGQGDRSPLKHTVNVPPMGNVVIEFAATENQDWLFHCHNQYHMKTGMNRVISYLDSSTFDAEMGRSIQPFQRWFSRTQLGTHSNFADLAFSLSDERHQFELELDADIDDTYEIDASYTYHFNRYFSAFVGTETKEHHHENSGTKAIGGLSMTLPMMIGSEWRVDDEGGFRLELDSEFQLTRRIGFAWRWNTDEEYRYGFKYSFNKQWALFLITDTEYGDGVGLDITF